MATLEKIRSKSVFLFVIIIVALLAFILGDFITSGKFYTSSTTMLKVGDQKVDYQHDYQPAINQAQNQSQGQDGDELAVTTAYQVMMQKLINQEIEKMGIKVTDSEISSLMKGPQNFQFLYYMAQQVGLPSADGESVFAFIQDPKKYQPQLTAEQAEQIKNSLLQAWTSQEDAMEEQLKNQIYFGLLSGLFTANELDAQAVYADNINRKKVDYVAVPVQPAADAEVSAAEMQQAYDQMKYRFATYSKSPYSIVEPARAIDYIVVPIVPSAADIQSAGAETAELAANLKETEGSDALSGTQGFSTQTVTVKRADIAKNADLRSLPEEYIVENAVYEFPYNPASYTYEVVKVLGTDKRIDEVKMSVVAADTLPTLEEYAAMLAQGATMDSIVTNAKGRGFVDQTVHFENAAQYGMPFTDANFRAHVNAAEVGKFNTYVDDATGLILGYVVAEREEPQDYVTALIVKRVVDPSVETQTRISERLNSFLASNANAEAFSTAARDSSYMLQNGYIIASSSHVGNLDGTRRAVKWIMKDGKVGSVSPIYEARVKANPNMPDRGVQNAYLVVAIKDEVNGAYLPMTSADVKPAVETKARTNKKAAEIAAQYADKAGTLEAFSQATDQPVMTDSTFVFSGNRLGAIYAEPAIFGAIAGAQPGTVVGPVQGDKDVVVFVVSPAEGEARPYDFSTDSRTFMQNYGMRLNQQAVIFNLLIGDRTVKNDMLKFVADEQ